MKAKQLIKAIISEALDISSGKELYEYGSQEHLNELDKLGALVGTLVYCRKERVIVWVQPQYTQKISRNNTKVSSALLEKMGDVICSDQDFEWIGIVDLFFHSLIVEKVYRISLN